MTIDEMIVVLQAAKAGKQIESRAKSHVEIKPVRYRLVPEWELNSGDFAFDVRDYRVKPEPREWYVSIDSRGCFRNAGEILPYGSTIIEYVRVREVLL